MFIWTFKIEIRQNKYYIKIVQSDYEKSKNIIDSVFSEDEQKLNLK